MIISRIVLDDNQKLLINEVLVVLIDVGTFTSTSSFSTQSLQFFIMNELKKVYTGRYVTFCFLIGSSIQCLISSGILSYQSINVFQGKIQTAQFTNIYKHILFLHGILMIIEIVKTNEPLE